MDLAEEMPQFDIFRQDGFSVATLSTQPPKGTRDFLPEEMSVRQQVFSKLFRTAELFGFRRYDGPVLESAAIYEAKSGDEIVNQQMYLLRDRGGRELALRPEMTPSVARMVAAHQNEIVFPARWYSHVNCHRYERPQRGRVREHWQLNVDIFGAEEVTAEVEIFELIEALLRSLGATPDMYVLRVNDRTLIDAALTKFVGLSGSAHTGAVKLTDRWEKLDEPARSEAVALLGLTDEQRSRFEQLVCLDFTGYCEAAGPEASATSRLARIIRAGLCPTPLHFDPLIVRGFDYYTSTVFEVFDTDPDNRRSLFGGGRYDDLAALFTPRRIPGIGFGMGDVTAWNFLESRGLLPKPDLSPDVFVFGTDPANETAARDVARRLREAGIRTVPAMAPMSMREGMRMADRLGVRYAAFIGENEAAQGLTAFKNMATSEQRLSVIDDLVDDLAGKLAHVK